MDCETMGWGTEVLCQIGFECWMRRGLGKSEGTGGNNDWRLLRLHGHYGTWLHTLGVMQGDDYHEANNADIRKANTLAKRY